MGFCPVGFCPDTGIYGYLLIFAGIKILSFRSKRYGEFLCREGKFCQKKDRIKITMKIHFYKTAA